MTAPIRITSPLHGDVLNRHDRIADGETLVIGVFGEAKEGVEVTVNGQAAEREGTLFRCRVPLAGTTTDLVARLGNDAGEDRITVLWDRTDKKRYRFSLDDNVRFLSDIAKEPDSFPSLFDHFYLGFWKRMHDEYGTKVHCNIYYQECWGVLPEGQEPWFSLSMMPDRYRDEWQANADWLRLSFHAREDKPDRIYKDATYDEMARDFESVMSEIRRFAGEEVTSRFTTVHWAEAPLEACRALRERGIEGLLGLFVTSAPDSSFTRYYLSPEMSQHIAEREAWKDLDEDIVFISCDAVVNGLALDKIDAHLDAVEANPHTAEMLELLIHEQYFRRELRHFQPDVFDKAETAIRWAYDRGYEPTFWQEGLLDALK
jgi:hypothetical protein